MLTFQLVSDDAHKAVGILTIKNGKRIIGKNEISFVDLMTRSI